jgi:hypothetical protein
VRFPAKRITTGEMRKRVRNVLEYIGRVQVEEGKRLERAKALGIEVKPLPPKARKQKEKVGETEAEKVKMGDEEGDVVMGESTVEAGPTVLGIAEEPGANRAQSPTAQSKEGDDPEEEEPKITSTTRPTSAQLLDELTRDLIAFQDTWAAGGFLSPLPPSSAVFAGANGDWPSSRLAKSVGAGQDDGQDQQDQEGGDGEVMGGVTVHEGQAVENRVPDRDEAVVGGDDSSGEAIAKDDGAEEAGTGRQLEGPVTLDAAREGEGVGRFAEEPVDVYGEGEMSQVVAQPIEEVATSIEDKLRLDAGDQCVGQEEAVRAEGLVEQEMVGTMRS